MLQFDSIELIPDGRWKFTWTGSSTDEFNLIQDGRILATVIGTEYTYPLPLDMDDPPSLELVAVDDTGESQDIRVAPYTTFQWYGSSLVRNYVVEQYIDGEWQVVDHVTYDPNVAVYTYTSSKLEDGSSNQFRVTGYDQFEQPSTPVTITKDIVCHPDFKMNQDNVLVTYVEPNLTVAFEV